MIKKTIKILPGINEVSEFLIKEWKLYQKEALNNKNYFTVALSGGKTPKYFYKKLAEQKDKFKWEKTYIFMVDERYVSSIHIDNNYKMIKENLFNKINIPEKNIFSINTQLSLNKSVIDYENRIKNFFKHQSLPSFDLVLLGIGNDGHTASLFPKNKILKETKKIVASVKNKNINHKRITLTYPIINNTKNIIFLVTGEKKAHIIKKIIENKNKNYPASRINPINGNLLFLLDEYASKELIYIS